ADARMYIDETLTLDGAGNYSLFVDSYVIEGGSRAVVGDDSGLGLVLTTKAEGTYVDNGDGTVTTSAPSYAVFEMQTDTYSSQMKGAAQMNVNGNDADGVYDSNDEPAVLDFVPETVWTLSDGQIVTYRLANEEVEEQPAEEPAAEEATESVGGVTVYSDDGATEITFNPDGTYRFWFGAYSVEDLGTYTYENGVLTLTNANGAEATAEGDPLKLHYVTAVSDQLTGDYTIDASALSFESAASEAPAGEVVVALSDDGATEITFNPDGTYRFWFGAYSVEDLGTYTYENGVLTLTNSNGAEATAEGDPLKLHYVTAVSDMLAGDYTIPASSFNSTPEAETAQIAETVTVFSDDGATEITFNPDGTYRFWFGAYSVEDLGTYTFENGVLTLTNANGAEATADGNPLKLHYVTAVSDMLTGDYTIDPSVFDFSGSAAPAAPSAAAFTALSDDGATEITFNPDGTYRFWFGAYSVEDLGTYTYENGVLTLVNSKGTEATAEGDPLKLHYITAVSDQLTGDYTIPANTFKFAVASDIKVGETASAPDELSGLTALSNDRGTSLTLFSDGTYRFWFAPYEVEDLGNWKIADGILSVTDANGKETIAEGTPYKLHYTYSMSDQLTGDYTIPVCIFPFVISGTNVPSDDLATNMTFFADGSYVFSFDTYSVMDTGSWTFENGILTLTDVNNVQSTAEGESLKLHYAYSLSDQLTGDFTIDPAIFG
ncbi:MAG: hypothetical protein ILP14_06295, partial [Oscillospiraceae bacterium]|nr:hypothetical protein [Oscillospiraceae bacterium]